MNPHELNANLPSLGLGLQDIQVLSTLIGSYLVYLRKGVLPSKQRDAEMVLLAGIHRRMLAILFTDGGMIPLTTAEIQALANALQGSARLMRQMMTPPAQRNEALKQMRAIREHLLRMLVGRND